MRWFGQAYGAPYEAECDQVETPVGQACGWCDEAIVEGDDGLLIPILGGGRSHVPYHYACQMRSVIGGVNHQLGACICCGGILPPDPPELTRREAAQAALDAFTTPKIKWIPE
jgi:hypothetical protein